MAGRPGARDSGADGTDRDAVAALALGAVERLVRRTQQVVDVAELLQRALRGESCRKGHMQGLAAHVGHRRAGHFRQDPAYDLRRGFLADAGQHHQEFLATVAGNAVTAAQVALQQLCDLLQHLVTGIELRVTASFGVAQGGTDALGWRTLLRAADAAMYQAKAQGRDRVRVAGGGRVPR